VKLNTVGQATHYTPGDSANIRIMTTIDFFFESKAMRIMAKDMEIYINSLSPVDFSQPELFKGLMEILGKEKADKAIADLTLYGSIKRFPDELEKTFFFNDVEFKYYPELKSFISTGQLGLGNILKNEINRYVPGWIKIDKMRSGGDKITIYVKIDQNTWYYFEFYKGLMSAVSSNNEFNTILKELKPKSRKQEVKEGPSFQFNSCSPQKVTVFETKLKQAGVVGEEKEEKQEE